MANQDFDINIRVNANTAQVDAIRQSFEKLGAQVKVTNAEAAAGAAGGAGAAGAAGGLASAAGIGTIISLVSGAVKAWEGLQDELDKSAEKMARATEKSHELGLEVVKMFEAMKSAERIDTEPLQVSFDRLKQKVIELKTEMHIAFEHGAYEDAKKTAAELRVVESQLDRVTTSMDKEAAAADRLAKAKAKAFEQELSAQRQFLQAAEESASMQAKAILQNEEAARKTGDPAFQKTAEQLKKSASQGQLDEYEQLNKLLNPTERPGRAAGVGESQAVVDQLEKNRIDFQKMIEEQKKQTALWQ